MLMVLLDSMERITANETHLNEAMSRPGRFCMILLIISFGIIGWHVFKHRQKLSYKHANAVYKKLYRKYNQMLADKIAVPDTVKNMIIQFEYIQKNRCIDLYDFERFISQLNKKDFKTVNKFVDESGIDRSDPGSRIALKAMHKRFKEIKEQQKQRIKQQKTL